MIATTNLKGAKAAAATPAADLRKQIMDSRIPKNEREWWAHRTIIELVEALEWAVNDMQGVTKYTNPEQWHNSMDRALLALDSAKGEA
jgi:hypothetical protein